MPQTLAFIHTTPVLIPQFNQLAKQILTGYRIFHMVDESLIKNTIAAGKLTKTTVRRLVAMVGLAREGGADAVMVTCSSIGPATTQARLLYDFPVFRIDEAMAERAVSTGQRIGVAATVQTTLDPTVALLREVAMRSKKQIEIVPRLAEGAFDAVMSGDSATHDALVRSLLDNLSREVDVVVLAQASMAGVLSSVKASESTILSSPELAVRQAHEVLSRLRLEPA